MAEWRYTSIHASLHHWMEAALLARKELLVPTEE